MCKRNIVKISDLRQKYWGGGNFCKKNDKNKFKNKIFLLNLYVEI
jgi:hypothetical protein